MLSIVERKVDGSLVGLSKELSVDMYEPGGMPIDLKTREPRTFHRYSLAG
jgi:CRISPR/Cas system-associated exonuclease Cas4 (RecB family)